MIRLLMLATFLLLLGLPACTPRKPVDIVPDAEANNGMELNPPTAVPPVANSCTSDITFIFQKEKPLLWEPLPVLADSVAENEISSELGPTADIMQGFYRMNDDGLPHNIYSYIEIDGNKYDLGQVGYGEGTLISSGNMDYQLASEAGLNLEVSDTVIYQQYKTYGAKYDAVAYYVIEGGVPFLLTEIVGVEQYFNLGFSNVVAVLSTDRSLPYTEYTVSKLDLREKTLIFTNLTELLECDGVFHDGKNGLFYTYHMPTDSGHENPTEGCVYSFHDGVFIHADAVKGVKSRDYTLSVMYDIIPMLRKYG